MASMNASPSTRPRRSRGNWQWCLRPGAQLVEFQYLLPLLSALLELVDADVEHPHLLVSSRLAVDIAGIGSSEVALGILDKVCGRKVMCCSGYSPNTHSTDCDRLESTAL